MRGWMFMAIIGTATVIVVGAGAYGANWLDNREEAREYAGGLGVESARDEAVEALANQRPDALELVPVRKFRGHALGRETWIFVYGKVNSEQPLGEEQVCVYVWSPNGGYDERSIVGECR